MADPLYGLTATDHEVLRNLISWYRSANPSFSTQNRPAIERERNTQSTQLYVARTPTGGIPALTENIAGSPSDDEPGSAVCNIYEVLRANTPETVTLSGADTKTVFNLSTTAIAENTWIIIAKDSFGTWVAMFGGGVSFVYGRLIEKSYTGTVPVYVARRITPDSGADPDPWSEHNLLRPCYEVNNVDVTVTNEAGTGTLTGLGTAPDPTGTPTIVKLWRGAGDYYLFECRPRWEFVKPTSEPDSGGYMTGKLMRYDQDTKALVEVEDILIVDLNGM